MERSDLSKEAQLARSPGQNRRCVDTLVLKTKCSCPKCRGWRNNRKGRKAQSKTRKALGLHSEKFIGRQGNEETWHSSHLRYEVKSGKQAEPVNTRYVEARTQADAAKPIGDTRPFVYVAAPDGTMPLLVIRSDELEEVIAAYLEEWAE